MGFGFATAVGAQTFGLESSRVNDVKENIVASIVKLSEGKNLKEDKQEALSFPDGSFYHGEFSNGEPSGYGVYQSNEFKYEGNLISNNMFKLGAHGRGTLWINNKKVYEGEFENGEFNGQGVLYCEDKVKYVCRGQFKNGKLHGNAYVEETIGCHTKLYKCSFNNGALSDPILAQKLSYVNSSNSLSKVVKL